MRQPSAAPFCHNGLTLGVVTETPSAHGISEALIDRATTTHLARRSMAGRTFGESRRRLAPLHAWAILNHEDPGTIPGASHRRGFVMPPPAWLAELVRGHLGYREPGPPRARHHLREGHGRDEIRDLSTPIGPRLRRVRLVCRRRACPRGRVRLVENTHHGYGCTWSQANGSACTKHRDPNHTSRNPSPPGDIVTQPDHEQSASQSATPPPTTTPIATTTHRHRSDAQASHGDTPITPLPSWFRAATRRSTSGMRGALGTTPTARPGGACRARGPCPARGPCRAR